MHKKIYPKYFLMLGISFIIMYGIMFLNVVSLDHIYLSLTRLYMALLMVSSMAVLMMIMRWSMFPNKKINLAVILGGLIIFTTALGLLRTQTPVRDEQYMKAMISHHSSAILTSQEANLQDPEVQALAQDIIEAQEREIEQMKNILKRLK